MKAFVFPGQGSQKVGMGKDLVENYKLAEEIYKTADKVLGFSISNLSFEGGEDELTKTQNAQPAILTYSYIAAELLYEKKISPDFVAGHSLGEFSALLAAGMVHFDDAVAMVRKRGELMSVADPDGKGGMAAVLGLDDDTVRRVCAEVSKTSYVEPVNYNCPGQVVISGLKEGIDAAEPKLKEAGAKRVLKLSVSGAFHSRLMEKAAEEFGAYIEKVPFHKPRWPVISNVTAQPMDETTVRGLLVRQMKSPVLWTDSVRYMTGKGVDTFVEVGFGSVVGGLVKKIAESSTVQSWNQLLV